MAFWKTQDSVNPEFDNRKHDPAFCSDGWCFVGAAMKPSTLDTAVKNTNNGDYCDPHL